MNIVETCTIILRSRVARTATLAIAVTALASAFVHPAAAQFSAREGFTADGAAHWSFEVSPYLFLPHIDATIGLAHPAIFDVSVNQQRPTTSKLVSSLSGAFTGDSLVRYGNWSAELDIFYVAASTTKTFPPLLPNGPGASLKADVSGVLVSPGIGYQVLPTDASSQLALDLRAGLSYNSISADASFARSLLGGVSYSTDFVQPWLGARLSFYPTPKWRLTGAAALTGLGVDGGAVGWNGQLKVAYLVTSWADVSLGYAATQTRRYGNAGLNGESRSIDLLAYGPMAAIGFRF